MKRQYKVRMHESGENDGETEAGTLVFHIGGGLAVEAKSIDEVEDGIQKQIDKGTLARGCVYQICPPPDSNEPPRALAVSLSGEFRECRLNNAKGFYSEFHRISFAAPTAVGTH